VYCQPPPATVLSPGPQAPTGHAQNQCAGAAYIDVLQPAYWAFDSRDHFHPEHCPDYCDGMPASTHPPVYHGGGGYYSHVDEYGRAQPHFNSWWGSGLFVNGIPHLQQSAEHYLQNSVQQVYVTPLLNPRECQQSVRDRNYSHSFPGHYLPAPDVPGHYLSAPDVRYPPPSLTETVPSMYRREFYQSQRLCETMGQGRYREQNFSNQNESSIPTYRYDDLGCCETNGHNQGCCKTQVTDRDRSWCQCERIMCNLHGYECHTIEESRNTNAQEYDFFAEYAGQKDECYTRNPPCSIDRYRQSYNRHDQDIHQRLDERRKTFHSGPGYVGETQDKQRDMLHSEQAGVGQIQDCHGIIHIDNAHPRQRIDERYVALHRGENVQGCSGYGTISHSGSHYNSNSGHSKTSRSEGYVNHGYGDTQLRPQRSQSDHRQTPRNLQHSQSGHHISQHRKENSNGSSQNNIQGEYGNVHGNMSQNMSQMDECHSPDHHNRYMDRDHVYGCLQCSSSESSPETPNMSTIVNRMSPDGKAPSPYTCSKTTQSEHCFNPLKTSTTDRNIAMASSLTYPSVLEFMGMLATRVQTENVSNRIQHDEDEREDVQFHTAPSSPMSNFISPMSTCIDHHKRPVHNLTRQTDSIGYLEKQTWPLESGAQQEKTFGFYDSLSDVDLPSDTLDEHTQLSTIVGDYEDDNPPILSTSSLLYESDTNTGQLMSVGRGTFGEVYLARIVNTQSETSRVVVKEFDEKHTTLEETFAEAKTLWYLRDTGYVPWCFGLVQLLGSTSDSINSYGIVQDYVAEGRTLERFLWRRIDVTATEWIAISIQLAEGLAFFHKKDILVNDLKTNNVLIATSPCRVTYIDFGLATFRSGRSYTATPSMDTFVHLAPEVRQGEETSTASDVYSLGWVLNQIETFGELDSIGTVTDMCMLDCPDERLSASGARILLCDLVNIPTTNRLHRHQM
jgi:hypothetical protein